MNRISVALVLLSFAACAKEPASTEKEPVPQSTGITVSELRSVSANETEIAAGNATVADVTELVNAMSQRASTIAQRDQAAAKLRASRAELDRLRALNADNHNVSDRAVQDAASAVASDEASVQSANAAALAAEAAARQRWGSVLAYAPQLASREEVLLEVAFTADIAPPAHIRVTSPSGRSIDARYLAPSPHIDARLQKPVQNYIAPGHDLPAGFITTVHAPLRARGVLVPRSAVVWNGEQPLVFVEDRPGHYAPHPISARVALDGGFIETTLQPGQRVVTVGAQQLLSEEHKPEVE